MRILFTGMTSQQCGSGTQLDYEPVADLLVKALRHSGHAVDQRPYDATVFDAESYDHVVVGLVPPLSIAGKYVNNALFAIYHAEQNGTPLTFFVDDWRFPRLVTNLGTCERMPEQLVKPFFSSRAFHELSKLEWNHEILQKVITRLKDETWPPAIIPAYGWGDHDKLASKLPRLNRVRFIDPTAFCRTYEIPTVDERKREWILGTVSDQRGWVEKLGATWPVRYLGSRSSKAEEKLKEADLVSAYGGSWGVLSPYYSQVAGTGWWRNRFVYAAAADAVLWCDQREAPKLGESFMMPIKVTESATERELHELARVQGDIFRSWTPSADNVASNLTDFLAVR
jgi:hypothetical protein